MARISKKNAPRELFTAFVDHLEINLCRGPRGLTDDPEHPLDVRIAPNTVALLFIWQEQKVPKFYEDAVLIK